MVQHSINVFRTSLVTCFSMAVCIAAVAQGTFQNLDFEQARIIPIAGRDPDQVAISNALPSWSASSPIIVYDTISLGAAAISIHDQLDKNPSLRPLSGSYSVLLQGSYPPRDSAYIWQNGTIPEDAKSLRFLSDAPGTQNRIFASFAGEEVSLTLLEARFPYEIGGDIAKFAGQTGELRFWGGAMLDSITFSPQAIPEPSLLSFITAAIGLYAARAIRRRTPWQPVTRRDL